MCVCLSLYPCMFQYTKAALCCPCYMRVGARGRLRIAHLVQARIYSVFQVLLTLITLLGHDILDAVSDPVCAVSVCVCVF